MLDGGGWSAGVAAVARVVGRPGPLRSIFTLTNFDLVYFHEFN
jgi:hypothetical protein